MHERWLEPFNNTIYHALADFHEYDLSALADRIALLPAKTYQDYQRNGIPV